jgi:hypothetical protein
MPKKDAATKRLAEWREIINVLRHPLGLTDFDCEIVQLPGGIGALLKAFEYFRLDPENASHNGLLLQVLANVCFAPRLRRKKWDDLHYIFLARCFETISNQHEGISENKAAVLIKQQIPFFGYVTPDAIRRRLPEARKRLEQIRQRSAEGPKRPKGLLSSMIFARANDRPGD